MQGFKDIGKSKYWEKLKKARSASKIKNMEDLDIGGNGFSPLDFRVTSNTDEVYSIELKYRDIPSTKEYVQKEGAVIEWKKYRELKKSLTEISGCSKCFYVMVFNDKAYSFDLTNEELTFAEDFRFPKTTMGDNKEKIRKMVAFLPLSKGKTIDIWT